MISTPLSWRPDQARRLIERYTLELLHQAQNQTESRTVVISAEIAECDRKLARYRAALDADADPVVVAGWIREAQKQRDAAEARRAQIETREEQMTMTTDEIKSWVQGYGGLLKVLRTADPTDKAEVYRQLGTKLTFDHEKRVVLAEAQPRPPVGVLVVSEGRADHWARLFFDRAELRLPGVSSGVQRGL